MAFFLTDAALSCIEQCYLESSGRWRGRVPCWKPASLEVMWASGLVWAGTVVSMLCSLFCPLLCVGFIVRMLHLMVRRWLLTCHLGKESPVCHISIDLGNCIPLHQSLRPQGGHCANWHVWPEALLWILKQYLPDLMAATQCDVVVPQKNIWVLLGRGERTKAIWVTINLHSELP